MQETTLNNKQYLLITSTFNIEQSDLTSGHLLIGKVSDILKDEGICKGLVEEANEQLLDVNSRVHYKDYRSASWELDYDKATDSFQSWLDSINLDLTKEYFLIQKQKYRNNDKVLHRGNPRNDF